MDEKRLLTLANWSQPKEIQTRNGPRILRKAAVTDAFRVAWKQEKDALKALGANFTKDQRTGDWELCWWQEISAEEIASRQQSVEASRATSADVDIPRPDGMEYYPFQKAGIRYATQRMNVLIADEMGLGKSIQAIGIINSDPAIKNAIIVCPKSLMLNWKRELEKWLVRPMRIGIGDAQADICIINYEGLNKRMTALTRPWGAMIVDEAHYIKNKKTTRSQNVKAIAAYAGRNIRLTGTPIVNRPVELYNIISDLHPAWGNFWQFAKSYCGAHHNGFGWEMGGASNLDELQQRLRSTVMVRRLKAEVLTELPRKIRQIIEVEATGSQAKNIRREQEFEAASEERLANLRAAVELSKAESDEAYQAAVTRLAEASEMDFTELARLRHETALAKVDSVAEHVRTILEDDETQKVIIAGHHHDVIDQIANALLDFHPVALTGATKLEDRQAAVDRFQNDPRTRVFIGSIMAAGVGITLTRASVVVFAELDWVPGNITQMEDRAHRIGQVNTVLIQHLVLADSLDARMARMLVEKQKVIDGALDTRHPERQYAAYQPAEAQPARERIEYQPRQTAATQTTSREDLNALADRLTEAQRHAAHRALQILASNDLDRANKLNGIGFNKIDGQIGHDLAYKPDLTARQAALAWKLARKYHAQLPADVAEQLSTTQSKGD